MHLQKRWKDLFAARFEVLLYDLTSTYFECDAPENLSQSKKRYGYSRDKRPDCVQVVIALVITPEGFPLAYEVLAGNTQDKQTLRGFLKKIESLYGKADRIWCGDRGMMSQENIEFMESGNRRYIIGASKGKNVNVSNGNSRRQTSGRCAEIFSSKLGPGRKRRNP